MGIPCLSAEHTAALALQAAIEADPTLELQIDLQLLQARTPAGTTWPLSLAAGPRQMLSTGQWDGTGQLLANDRELLATVQRLPYLQAFAPAG